MPAPSLTDRALAALDEAFSEQIKSRFNALVNNEHEEPASAVLARFGKGLGELNLAYAGARAVIVKVFGEGS